MEEGVKFILTWFFLKPSKQLQPRLTDLHTFNKQTFRIKISNFELISSHNTQILVKIQMEIILTDRLFDHYL